MAVFTALLIIALLMVSAIVVDIGMQRVARADMQALADVVALDLARELDGRSVAALKAVESGLVATAIARNPDTIGSEADLDIAWGAVGDDGDFEALASGSPTAVRVTAATVVAFAFSGVTGVDEGDARRNAVASASSSACFRLGSFVAAVRSGDSALLAPLGDLLGVDLKLVGYQGLAAADVTLGELAASSYIGSPERLLTGTVTYADLVHAMIDVLSDESPTANKVAIDALGVVLDGAGQFGSLRLGDVIHVAPTDEAALDVALQVLDVLGNARMATGEHFLEIPNLHAGVAGLGNKITGSIALISAAELACGAPNSPEAVADTAQLSGTLGIEFVNLPSLNLGIGTLQTGKGTGSLVVEVGKGTGQLVSPPVPHCGDGTAGDPHTFSVRVGTQTASYRLSMDLSVGGDLKLSALDGLGLGDLLGGLLSGVLGNKKTAVDIGVTLSVGTTAGPGTSTADLRMPPNDTTPVETGSSVYLDPSKLVATITGVKIGGNTIDNLAGMRPLTDLVVAALTSVGNDFVHKTVAPLLENIDEILIGPVARMAGARFGGADVYAVGAVCGRPRLVG